MERKALSLLVMLLCLGLGFSMTAMAQGRPGSLPQDLGWLPEDRLVWFPTGPYKLLDTPDIKEQMKIARQLAGDDKYLSITQRLQCHDIDDTFTIHRNAEWDEATRAVPTKVFDNVYYVGAISVGGWVIDTGKGYIMLDSGWAYSYDSLIDNMKTLGLDPAKIKYILITHAGPDHIGAVPKFQEVYPDIKVIYNTDLGGRTPPIVTQVMKDGDTLTLGDTTITMVSTPRRVGGDGLSYFIPVKIKGKKHMWATYGNTNVVGTIADKKVYLEAIAKFLNYMGYLEPDIAISSHPFVDGSLDRMEIIRECDDQRGSHDQCGPHNPFLIGREEATRYMKILEQCALVQLMRQEAGLDTDGIAYLK